jgi:hypothetical protein
LFDTADTARAIVPPLLAWGGDNIAGFAVNWPILLLFLSADLSAGCLGAMVFILALALVA